MMGPNGAAMDGLAKIEADELIRRMREDFERTMAEVASAVNDAPDGHLIDGSEERVRDVLGEFRRRSFEQAAQMRIEATETSVAFSPGEAITGEPRGGGSVGAERRGEGADPPATVRQGRRGRGGNRAGDR
jgi:hypothetical protein